jgi:dodecin
LLHLPDSNPGLRCYTAPRFEPREGTMSSVAKIIEISASSGKGIEDAISSGLKKASRTVKKIKGAWVNEINVVTADDGSVEEWRVNMRISFLVD